MGIQNRSAPRVIIQNKNRLLANEYFINLRYLHPVKTNVERSQNTKNSLFKHEVDITKYLTWKPFGNRIKIRDSTEVTNQLETI